MPATTDQDSTMARQVFDESVSGGQTPMMRCSGARLGAVDGLRALAALWVVLFHMRAASGVRLVPGVDLVVRAGSVGVSLFLVLSGFCLYLPAAGGRLARFRTVHFFRRRCRRLLPAYLASLAVVLVAVVVAGGRFGLPKLTGVEVARQAAAHVTLTHQFLPSTFYGLNGAYWSLGLEWELYLVLPFLVFGVRRIGLPRVVALVVGANVVYGVLLSAAIASGLVAGHGALAAAVLPNLFLGRWGEFALGMVAAELWRTGRVRAWSARLRYMVVPAAVGGLLLSGKPLSHLLFGLAFFAILCTVLAGDNRVSRLLSWPPLVALGVMSYSLYLVHQPLLQVLASVLGGNRGVSPIRVFLELVLLLPVIVLAAWFLFLGVERGSLSPAAVGPTPAHSLGAAPEGALRCRRPLPTYRRGAPRPRGAGDAGELAANASAGAQPS